MTNKKGNAYVGVVLIIIALIFVVACLARQQTINSVKANVQSIETTTQEESEIDLSQVEIGPYEYFSFSKTEKNVVVIMLDRAISQYFPYIMEEVPGIKDQYSGFVYYPNTLSFGANTIFGSAAVFGGYEYTPEAVNNRTDELLVDKQNEALLVLPTIFSDAGYSVTVCDPPLAGYEWTPDLTIFDGIENCSAYNTIGMYDEQYGVDGDQFLQNYYVLKELPNMTNNYSQTGAYITITNEAPHRATYLQLPYYEPSDSIDNSGYTNQRVFSQDEKIYLETSIQETHYHALAASLVQLGNWFDYLKELGVYDNTRIIITSDHGYGIDAAGGFYVGNYDSACFNPLLIVKDFNSDFEYKIDGTFMTNADVPYLATKGVIKNATNPFTGNLLKDTVDKEEVHVMRNNQWRVEQNTGNTYGSTSYFSVKENIFDPNNWTEVTIYPTPQTEEEEEETTTSDID